MKYRFLGNSFLLVYKVQAQFVATALSPVVAQTKVATYMLTIVSGFVISLV